MEQLQTDFEKEKSSDSTILDFSFSDLVDIPDLQQLVNHLSVLAGCAIGILDVDNKFLAVAGFQKICSCFHRVHPETKNHCSESDCFIRQNLKTENPIPYKCKNGLWDVAYPIFIESKHVANIFFGQFFFDDEVIDIPFFEENARKYGFDKTEYFNALHEVPAISRTKVETLKHFNALLAKMLTNTGYANLLLKKEKIEELRIANEQLKDSELKFRKLFEQAGVGVALVEATSGKFLKINRKFADMLGYSMDELLQLSFKELTHPDDLQGNLHHQNLLHQKKISEYSTEKRYIRKDGTIVWAMLNVSFMEEIFGGDEYHISIVQDITDRKQSEEILRENEQRLKFHLDNSSMAVVEWDDNFIMTKWSGEAERMFGWGKEEVIGKHVNSLNIVYKEDIPLVNRTIEKLTNGKELTVITTNRNNTKSGAIIECVWYNSTLLDENGCMVSVMSLVQDITERKKAEQTLKEENERFHTTMDAIDSVVYVSDMENHEILFVNKYVADLFGDITSKKCYSALQGKTMPCDFCTNHLLLDVNGNPNQPHIWEFQNSITKRWYQCHDQAIKWTNGNLVRFEIATDITENKENELTLKENEIKLHELNSTKDKFFSIIAHDLKNPFSVLLSSSELLDLHLEKNDLPRIKAKAKLISKASKQGFSLLENLLEWAKSQTGTIKFNLKSLNLKNSVAACIAEVEDQAKKKDISITNLVSDDLILTADENLLSIIFRNLITNAIKFTHKGGSITIKAKTDHSLVEVSVIDTGIGIPIEHQHKLFRIDTNYSRAGTANESSTSLGLILCKEFIEKHNGKIWVESEVDKGSEFKFTIPRFQTNIQEPTVSEIVTTPTTQLNFDFFSTL